MKIEEVPRILSENKIAFKEPRGQNPLTVISTLAVDQMVLIVAPLNLVFVYEYENREALTEDREILYKKFKKNYFDGEVVEIITNNIYIVTSKDKGEKESRLEKQLKPLINWILRWYYDGKELNRKDVIS